MDGFWQIPKTLLSSGGARIGLGFEVLSSGGNCKIEHSGDLLSPFCGHGIASVNFLGAFGDQGPTMLKLSLLGPLGPIWWPRHQNAQNGFPGSFLGPFCGKGQKMLKLSLLGGLLGPFGSQGTKMLKMILSNPKWFEVAQSSPKNTFSD